MSVKHLLTERLDYSQLPLNQLPVRMILSIENALRIAWSRINADAKSKPILNTGNEDEITALIQSELEELRHSKSAAGYHESVFAMTERGSELISYNANHIKKSPDLIFRLKSKRPGLPPRLNIYDGIFVECKLITKSATVNDYVQNGLQRFVDGEYAWAVQQGLMMAYVRTTQDLPTTLDDYFVKHKTANNFNLISNLVACNLSIASPKVFTSKHGRSWTYPSTTSPGDIDVRHIWLNVED
jgi:hypothetical protein